MKFLRIVAYFAVLLSMIAARPSAIEEVAQSVTCGGMTWTDGEVLGQHNSKNVVTVIHEGRIYIKYQGEAGMIDNFAILFHLSNNRFPHSQYADRIDPCVNSSDPSTDTRGYLGSVVNNTISCNGDVYTDGLWLGDYRGGDGVITKQYAIIEDGLLRINYHREGTPYQRKDISSALIKQTIAGENGSYMNPNLGFSITSEEIDACVWGNLPKYPDGAAPSVPSTPDPGSSNCQGGPTLGTISNVSATGLTFQFDATNVSQIKWEVKSNGSVVASGTTPTLTSSTVPITFGTSLASGNYTLEIQGASCTSSVSSKSFSVSLPACVSTPVISNITNISTTGLVLHYTSATMSRVQWEIRNGSTVVANGITSTSAATATFSYAALAPGNYTLAVKSADCTSAFVTKAFTIPVPPLSPCQSGPVLKSTSNVSSTGLTFQFDALSVSQIKWEVKSGGTVVASGTTPQLTSAVVAISFGKTLASGNYTLEIQGASCTSSVSSSAFTIGSSACSSAAIIGTISNITTTGLKFAYTGATTSNMQWEIRNGSTVVASNTTATASGSVTIAYATLPAGNYTLAIKSADCTGSFNTKAFTIPLPACSNTALIGTISSISATGLKFSYSGVTTNSMQWEIRSGSTVVASNTTATASGSVTITYAALAGGNYTLAIKPADCTGSFTTKDFTIALLGAGNCVEGPLLVNTSSISTTGLTFQFHANGVNQIKWEVKSNGAVVASGTTPQLTSAVVPIAFGKTLAAGSYTLEIQGASCTSSISSSAFAISTPNCTTSATIGTISNISSTGLSFNYTGSGINTIEWEIRNGSTVVARNTTGVLGNTSVTISYATLSAGTYTLAIKSADCTGAFNTKSFTVPLTDNRTACNYGPNLMDVYNVTSTGLEFNFHGDGVYQLDWKILQNGNVVRQNRLSPTSDRPVVNFDALPDGQYTLEIQGGSCISTPSSMSFSVDVPLYIYIMSFKATQSDKGVDLQWSVVEEKNGDRFEVIRYDSDMQNAEVIGTVYLRDNSVGNYNFLDTNPKSGVNYYQLKMIDRDETFSESTRIAVNYKHIFDAMIAPNPAQDMTTISFVSKEAGIVVAHIYNLMGQKVGEYALTVEEGSNLQQISVKHLVEGHYFVKIIAGTQQMNLRLIKIN